MKYVFLNSKFVKEDEARISIKDRGFRFGDGIFETIKIHNSKPKDFQLHFMRLEEGLKEIKIDISLHKLLDNSEALIKKNKQAEGFLRIMITRGEGSMGYLPIENITPTLVIETVNIPHMKQRPASLIVSKFKKTPLETLPVNYKLIQGMNSSLAKIDAREQGFDDALMINHKNIICETSSANIFFINKGKIYTPSLDSGILRGVIREKILNNFPIIEDQIKLRKLKKFDLIFATNVAIEIKEITLIASQKKKVLWQHNPKKASLEVFNQIKSFLKDS